MPWYVPPFATGRGSDIALHDHGTQPLKGLEGTWQLFSAMPP
jgi:hypothetical protein